LFFSGDGFEVMLSSLATFGFFFPFQPRLFLSFFLSLYPAPKNENNSVLEI